MLKPNRVLTAGPRRWTYLRKSRGFVGVGAACVLAVVCNLFAARYERRWDLTTDARYTPSKPLREQLQRLPREVTAVVLLGHGDPLAPSIEQLLISYRNVSKKVVIDWVDPDREPARYLARQNDLGIRVGRTEDGQVTNDALLVLTSGERKYYVTPQDVTGLDPEHSDGGATFEHSFAVGLKSLFRATKPLVCFTTGHRELSLSDRSPIGLSRFKERLERDALTTQTLDIITETSSAIDACRVIVVASPDVPLSTNAIAKLSHALTSRSNLLLLGGVIPDSDGKLISLGFEPLAKLGGIELLPNVVIEYDNDYRLPELFGESFFASPAEHAVNRGLLRGEGDTPLRVVVSLAQSQASVSGGPARPLLLSSRKSVTLTDVSHLATATPAETTAAMTSHIVAMASTVEQLRAPATRLVVMPTNIVQNRSFENPALVVTQAFADSVVSWLTAEAEQEVEFTPRTERPLGLALSEHELSQIVRYVLWIMPLAVLLSGLGVYLLRRNNGRSRERRPQSRRD
jgi:hypothetical protein